MTRLRQSTVDLINYADPDEAHTGMVLARDLMGGQFSREHLQSALQNLREVLADPSVSMADLKGPLNRASAKSWGGEYHRVFTPREFLEALAGAIEAYLGKA